MSTILTILLFVVAIAVLVYWVKSLIVMKNEVAFLILGILFSPIAQLVYFFTKRDLMDEAQVTTMKRFFMAGVAYIVVFVIWSINVASDVAAQTGAIQ